jgi:hypothetical protein
MTELFGRNDDLQPGLAREFRNGDDGAIGRKIEAARLSRSGTGGEQRERSTMRGEKDSKTTRTHPTTP